MQKWHCVGSKTSLKRFPAFTFTTWNASSWRPVIILEAWPPWDNHAMKKSMVPTYRGRDWVEEHQSNQTCEWRFLGLSFSLSPQSHQLNAGSEWPQPPVEQKNHPARFNLNSWLIDHWQVIWIHYTALGFWFLHLTLSHSWYR